MGKSSSLLHLLVTVVVALFAVLLSLPSLLILSFVLFLQALIILDHLWLFIFIPEWTHWGRDGGLTGHAIEAVTIGAFMRMQRIASFIFFLSRLLLPFVAWITIIFASIVILLSNRYWSWNSSVGVRINNWFSIDSRVWTCLTSFTTKADSGSGFRISSEWEEGLYIFFDLIYRLRRSHHNISALAERIALYFSIAATSVNSLSGRVMCVLVLVDLLSGNHSLFGPKVHYFFNV